MRAIFTLMLICASLLANAFGYSEVFIQIAQQNVQPGSYTVRIDDQIITNSTGKFRFFDVRSGVKEVFIQYNGVNVFRGIISLYSGSRTVAEYRGLRGLQILQQVQLANTQLQDWYGWNYYYPNQNNWPNNPPGGGWNQPNPNNPYPNNPYPNNPYPNGPVGMDNNSFAQFKQTVKNQSFDSNKVSVIKNQARNANFTSAQVAELLQLMSFDSYKLDAAKYCYDFVIDKGNYFKTFDVFQFDSSVKELSTYIGNR